MRTTAQVLAPDTLGATRACSGPMAAPTAVVAPHAKTNQNTLA